MKTRVSTLMIISAFLWLFHLLIPSDCIAAEPLTRDELEESIKYPIPCHKIKAFHYVYGISTHLDGTFESDFIYGVADKFKSGLNDLIDQPYRYGEKYYLLPYVDIDDANRHGQQIKYWISYRALKSVKLIRSSVPVEDGPVIYQHAQYEKYSKLRQPQTRFGFRIKKSQVPYYVSLKEKRKPKLNDIWGDYIPNWDQIEVLSDSQRWQNEYAVTEMCIPTAIEPAEKFTDEFGFCENLGLVDGFMSTNITDYLEGREAPLCLAKLRLNHVLGGILVDQADQAEFILKGVILKSLPFVGTAYSMTECESFEDIECWGDVGVGALADIGSVLIPISGAGRLAMIARGTGKVVVGAAMAGNLILAANDLNEGRVVNAMARVVGAGFNLVELKLAPGTRILGGRRGTSSWADNVDCPRSGSTRGPKTTVTRGGTPTLCERLFGLNLPCSTHCEILPYVELDAAQLQRFQEGVEQVRQMLSRTANAESTGAVYSAIDELASLTQRTNLQELPPITVTREQLQRWAKGASSAEDLANKIERGFRSDVLEELDKVGSAPFYDPRNGGTINVARIQLKNKNVFSSLDVNDPSQRALKAVENRISIEEFHHSVGRRDYKGYIIEPAGGLPTKKYNPSNRGDIDGFSCWLNRVGHDELEAMLDKAKLEISPTARQGKDLVSHLRQELEEVDNLIELRKSGNIVTEAYTREYNARYLYSLYKQHLDSLAK